MTAWQKRVRNARKRLQYRLARKNQTMLFWSVGFYGMVWRFFFKQKPALAHFQNDLLRLETRITRIEQRYWYCWKQAE